MGRLLRGRCARGGGQLAVEGRSRLPATCGPKHLNTFAGQSSQYKAVAVHISRYSSVRVIHASVAGARGWA
eukprot:98490-Chlamydomonas_euryale.AAC.1